MLLLAISRSMLCIYVYRYIYIYIHTHLPLSQLVLSPLVPIPYRLPSDIATSKVLSHLDATIPCGAHHRALLPELRVFLLWSPMSFSLSLSLYLSRSLSRSPRFVMCAALCMICSVQPKDFHLHPSDHVFYIDIHITSWYLEQTTTPSSVTTRYCCENPSPFPLPIARAVSHPSRYQ